MPGLRLLADEEIPLVGDFFAPYCQLRKFAAPLPAPADLAWAEAVLLRSVTRLPPEALSHLKFVGTATIGTDHLPLDCLIRQAIPWSHAPGCNAEAVADWVAIALSLWSERQQTPLAGLTLGLIGYGHTGQAVARRAPALGLQVLTCDPPRAEAGEPGHCPLEQLLPQADLVSLHVPLTKKAPHSTWGMLNRDRLQLMKPGACLLNCSRGEVMEEAALLAQRPRLGGLYLDVFPGEPQPNPALLTACDLATPHIAGYSQQGKTRATWMLYQAMARQFGWPQRELPRLESLAFSWGDPNLAQGLESLFGFAGLTQALQAGKDFARLRQGYVFRPELSEIRLSQVPASVQLQLQALGFRGL